MRDLREALREKGYGSGAKLREAMNKGTCDIEKAWQEKRINDRDYVKAMVEVLTNSELDNRRQ